MPGQDGLEFFEAVRADDPNLPFILYTGHGSEALASDAISAGVKYDEWEDHPAVCKRAVSAIGSSHVVRYRWASDDAHEQPTVEDRHESTDWVADGGK